VGYISREIQIDTLMEERVFSRSQCGEGAGEIKVGETITKGMSSVWEGKKKHFFERVSHTDTREEGGVAMREIKRHGIGLDLRQLCKKQKCLGNGVVWKSFQWCGGNSGQCEKNGRVSPGYVKGKGGSTREVI